MNKRGLNKKDIIRKRYNNFKELVSTDLIEISVSIVISVLLEVTRALFSFMFLKEENLQVADLAQAFDINVWDKVNSIVLLTLIIWGVSGLAKIMENSNPGKRKKVHTLSLFLIFIICVIWYVAKIFFIVDTKMVIATSVLSMALLIFLTTYFIAGDKKCDIYNFDNRIA